ncbi:LacI family kdg operon repressor OS=Castellaniella defragrans OX=75697 GN=HNR28_002473 PE=4 SV=1 [Castellaniella defragrans]
MSSYKNRDKVQRGGVADSGKKAANNDIQSEVAKHRSVTTLKDVAALGGVSTATVSHVLNNTRRVTAETRARVFAAIEKLGYTGDGVARSLRRGRTAILGLVVSDIENPFFTVLASHVQRVAALRGYQVIFANSAEQRERERESINAMRAQRVDGIILAPVSKDNVAPLASQQISLVLVNRKFEDLKICSVVVDDKYGATLGFDHLWELGHRDIAVVHGDLSRSTTMARLDGIRSACTRHRIPFSKILKIDAGRSGSNGEAELNQVLATHPHPTAIFALSNWSMLAAVRALSRSALRCPGDISLVGLGTISPYWMPASSISLVEHPIEKMAAEAVRLVLDQIEGAPEVESIVLQPSFTSGLSSAPIPAPARPKTAKTKG